MNKNHKIRHLINGKNVRCNDPQNILKIVNQTRSTIWEEVRESGNDILLLKVGSVKTYWEHKVGCQKIKENEKNHHSLLTT